jgi:hypothetical protein
MFTFYKNTYIYSPIKYCFQARDLAEIIFEKLERKHGTLLTVRALSVITAARQGITAKNVEDIFERGREIEEQEGRKGRRDGKEVRVKLLR